MKTTKLLIGSDHAGFDLRRELAEILRGEGFEVVEAGAAGPWDTTDYPLVAASVSHEVLRAADTYGVLVCGSGIGMSISANRISGIRAALCRDSRSAELAMAHTKANVLTLGAWFTSPKEAGEAVVKWLDTSFQGGSHERRISLIECLGR